MKCTLSNAELIKSCEEWVGKLAKTGGAAWSLRVPVDFNHDPDMLFLEVCKRLREATPTEPDTKEPVQVNLGEVKDGDNIRIDVDLEKGTASSTKMGIAE